MRGSIPLTATMPYEIRKAGKGYVVMTKGTRRTHSKKALSKQKADEHAELMFDPLLDLGREPARQHRSWEYRTNPAHVDDRRVLIRRVPGTTYNG